MTTRKRKLRVKAELSDTSEDSGDDDTTTTSDKWTTETVAEGRRGGPPKKKPATTERRTTRGTITADIDAALADDELTEANAIALIAKIRNVDARMVDIGLRKLRERRVTVSSYQTLIQFFSDYVKKGSAKSLDKKITLIPSLITGDVHSDTVEHRKFWMQHIARIGVRFLLDSSYNITEADAATQDRIIRKVIEDMLKIANDEADPRTPPPSPKQASVKALLATTISDLDTASQQHTTLDVEHRAALTSVENAQTALDTYITQTSAELARAVAEKDKPLPDKQRTAEIDKYLQDTAFDRAVFNRKWGEACAMIPKHANLMPALQRLVDGPRACITFIDEDVKKHKEESKTINDEYERALGAFNTATTTVNDITTQIEKLRELVDGHTRSATEIKTKLDAVATEQIRLEARRSELTLARGKELLPPTIPAEIPPLPPTPPRLPARTLQRTPRSLTEARQFRQGDNVLINYDNTGNREYTLNHLSRYTDSNDEVHHTMIIIEKVSEDVKTVRDFEHISSIDDRTPSWDLFIWTAPQNGVSTIPLHGFRDDQHLDFVHVDHAAFGPPSPYYPPVSPPAATFYTPQDAARNRELDEYKTLNDEQMKKLKEDNDFLKRQLSLLLSKNKRK